MSSITEKLYNHQNTKSIANEVDEVDVRLLFQVLKRRKRLAMVVLVCSMIIGSAATLWQRINHPVFQGGFKLLVSDPINPSDGSTSSSDSNLEQLALSGSSSTTDTGALIQVLTSPLLLMPVESRLGLSSGSLQGNLSVTTTRNQRSLSASTDGVLDIRLQWSDPEQGKAILDQLSREYLAYSLRQRQEKLTQGLSFLDQQAPDLQRRVNSLQSQLADFRRSHGFVAPDQQALAILTQREKLSSQIDDLQQQEARFQEQLAALQKGQLLAINNSTTPSRPKSLTNTDQSDKGGQTYSTSNPSPKVSSSLQELDDIETALAEAQANYTDQAPQVLDLKEKRNRLFPIVQKRQISEVQGNLSQNISEQKQIKIQLNRLSRTFTTNPTLIKQYEALQQQLVVASENLTSYIKARENFRLQVAQRTVPWSVLSPANFSKQPVKPSIPRNMFAAFLLGSLGGIGFAFIRDRLDHVYHDPLELRSSISLPLLGVVPYFQWDSDQRIADAIRLVDKSKLFEIRESLRNLYASFRLLRADKTIRLFALTSSSQGEGKSSTSVLFALTLAELGQKVLLIDADMRRPRLHRYLGVANGEGLSTVLTNPEFLVRDSIQVIDENLHLIPSGPMPPDTTQLLSSARCKSVVDEIRNLNDYDLIIFDTPPAYLLSDAILLSENLDGLLFVVGIDCVSRDLPVQTIERIKQAGVDILGLLASHPVNERTRKASYGYNYFLYGYSGYQKMVGRYIETHKDGSSLSSAPVALDSGKANLHHGFQRIVHWLDRRG